MFKRTRYSVTRTKRWTLLAATCAVTLLAVPATASAVSVKQVDAGLNVTCSVRLDGEIACWGIAGDHDDSPAGPFAQVSVGDYHACGVRTNGDLACWGDNQGGRASPPSGHFTQVSASYLHSCAAGDELWCWGDNTYGAAHPIQGTYTQVSAGPFHTCAVRTDGTIACWGTEDFKQYCEQESCTPKIPPPAGTFTQVAAGRLHTCALRTDGTIACWGSNDKNRSTPPDGTFTQLDAGAENTCAVRTSGEIVCWGDGADDLQPPAGTYKTVSDGDGHACAIRTDDEVICFGSNTYGESTPNVDLNRVPPVVSKLKVSRTRFRAAKTGPSVLPKLGKTGTKVSYGLSETANVTFEVYLRKGGRYALKGDDCEKATRRTRNWRKCDLFVGSFVDDPETADKGANSLVFSGRTGRKTLAPGRYWLAANATDLSHDSSKSVRTAFEVKR